DAALLGGGGKARARRRLGLALAYDGRRPRARLLGRGSRPPPEYVLGRRADASLARPLAGRRPRPAPARRADQPPRRRQPRVARDDAGVARRGGDPRRTRPLVPG